MKKQILHFEEVEGRSLEARRLYNARAMGLLDRSSLHILHGGTKLGQGLEKCVYDSNTHLQCIRKNLPPLPDNQVNVILSSKAYLEEKEAKRIIKSLTIPLLRK